MVQNMGLESKIKTLEGSEQKLQFHSLKSSLASYSPSTLFLTFRWFWDFWKWFQMIAHAQKHGVSSMFQKQSYKVTYLAILRGMIFPTYFLTPPPKNDENGQK